MCTYNVRIEDNVMERFKPHFKGDRAMKLWIEDLLRRAMMEYVDEQESQVQRDLESHKLVERLKALENDPDGFFKLSGVLKPSNYSADELRDDYVSEKYGI